MSIFFLDALAMNLPRKLGVLFASLGLLSTLYLLWMLGWNMRVTLSEWYHYLGLWGTVEHIFKISSGPLRVLYLLALVGDLVLVFFVVKAVFDATLRYGIAKL